MERLYHSFAPKAYSTPLHPRDNGSKREKLSLSVNVGVNSFHDSIVYDNVEARREFRTCVMVDSAGAVSLHEAIVHCRNLIVRYPSFVEGVVYLLKLYWKTRDIENFSNLIEDNPSIFKSYNATARSLLSRYFLTYFADVDISEESQSHFASFLPKHLLILLHFKLISEKTTVSRYDVAISNILDFVEANIEVIDLQILVDILERVEQFGEGKHSHAWIYRGRLVYSKILFKLRYAKRAQAILESYQEAVIGRKADQCIFGLGDTVHSLSKSGQGSYSWPKLMTRVDFRRLDPSYNSSKLSMEFEAGAVISSSPMNSYCQFPIDKSNNIYMDEYNIHPRYFVGLKDSHILSWDGRREILLNMTYIKKAVQLDGRSLLLGGAPNYYHWMYEYLPRMECIANANEYSRILVNHNFQEWQFSLLQLVYRVNRSKLFVMQPDVLYKCELLTAPTIRPIPNAVQYLRKQLSSAPQHANERIFISRQDADPARVRIKDEQEFFDNVLSPLGFRSYRLSSMSVKDQLALFSMARCVVAAHGAGLSNVVVVPKECVIIEVNNSTNKDYTFFSEISRQIGVSFVRLQGEDCKDFKGPSEDCPAVIDYSYAKSIINNSIAG